MNDRAVCNIYQSARGTDSQTAIRELLYLLQLWQTARTRVAIVLATMVR